MPLNVISLNVIYDKLFPTWSDVRGEVVLREGMRLVSTTAGRTIPTKDQNSRVQLPLSQTRRQRFFRSGTWQRLPRQRRRRNLQADIRQSEHGSGHQPVHFQYRPVIRRAVACQPLRLDDRYISFA